MALDTKVLDGPTYYLSKVGLFIWKFLKLGTGHLYAEIRLDKKKFLIIKEIDEKILYASSRVIEAINLPSNSPVRQELPESLIDCSSGLLLAEAQGLTP
ncbi:hypothetical protein DPMN_165118 [Dreissena polymorpha]|uniref:Uncharacterized protein n=1 Tax=Dreissena polymorpha TaxID=45954 RepID=A0A9D4EU59_DREPO|nr:hypothetical protein DPMN_165118 [Dreissena polymorpha]